MVPHYVMEPIPTSATYWCFHPSGSLSTAGHFNSDAEALAACGSGSQAFVEGHDAIVKRDDVTGEYSILWQFKAGFHVRHGASTNSLSSICSITNISVHDPRPTSPPMPTLPLAKPAVKARVTPVIAPSPVRGSTTVSVSGPPGTLVPKRWNWGRNAYLQDCVTDNMVTNAIGFVFDVLSNNTYRVWSAPNLAGPWTEYPMSTNVQPANGNFEWQHCLPLPTDVGQRFYQITSSNP